MLYVKNEENVWPRLLTGIVDVNNFFIGASSEFCSYRNQWSLFNIYNFRIKEIFVLLIIFILNRLQDICNYIPKEMKNNIYITRLLSILRLLYKDVFRHILL